MYPLPNLPWYGVTKPSVFRLMYRRVRAVWCSSNLLLFFNSSGVGIFMVFFLVMGRSPAPLACCSFIFQISAIHIVI